MTDDNNKECPLLRDTDFVDLMKRRIFNVLLIANPYDAFMLEDDGRVEEKIFDEYVKLGLRYPPRFFQVASQEEAEAEALRWVAAPGTSDPQLGLAVEELPLVREGGRRLVLCGRRPL